MSIKTEQQKLNQVIHSAETAYEDSIERQINELCNGENEELETFEFVLYKKVFHLYYGGVGQLPVFTKEQRPDDLYFIRSIEKIDTHGNYRLTTNSFATSDHIRSELEKLEVPC